MTFPTNPHIQASPVVRKARARTSGSRVVDRAFLTNFGLKPQNTRKSHVLCRVLMYINLAVLVCCCQKKYIFPPCKLIPFRCDLALNRQSECNALSEFFYATNGCRWQNVAEAYDNQVSWLNASSGFVFTYCALPGMHEKTSNCLSIVSTALSPLN